jgi:putative transposase
VSGNREAARPEGDRRAGDTHHSAATDPALRHLPERVTVAVAELANAAREGLLAPAVGTGLQVLQAMLAEDVAWLVGPKGRHLPEWTAVRHGSEPGQVTLGGRRVRVRRPRVRTADGSREVALPTYQAFAATDLLDQLAVERMLAKLSSRRYRVGLEPVGSSVEQAGSGTSKSAVSRRFVARTEHALAELLVQDLSGLDLVALMVDGIRVAEHCCRVLDLDGTSRGQ